MKTEQAPFECQTCARRSDWDFLRQFYLREDINRQQVQSLNQHVAQLTAALHHAGLTAQKDRVALNKSHDQMEQLQHGFGESQSMRARLENGLHEERQEHRICQERLAYERLHHRETEQSLETIWNSHRRLAEIVSKVQCQMDDGCHEAYMEYNITDLILELEAKAHKIKQLESTMGQQEEQSGTEIRNLQERILTMSTQQAEQTTLAHPRGPEPETSQHPVQGHLSPGIKGQGFTQSSGAGRRRKRYRGGAKSKEIAREYSEGEAATATADAGVNVDQV